MKMKTDYAYCINSMLMDIREHAMVLWKVAVVCLLLVVAGAAAVWNPLRWDDLPLAGYALLAFAALGIALSLVCAHLISLRLDCILRLRGQESAREAEKMLSLNGLQDSSKS